MKTELLFSEKQGAPLPPCAEDVWQDLELERIAAAMAEGDPVIAEAVRDLLLRPLTDAQELRQRQEVLRDGLRNADAVRGLYAVLCEALRGREKEQMWLSSALPSSRFYGAVHLLQNYLHCLHQVRELVQRGQEQFSSAGFQELFAGIEAGLDDDFLRDAKALLEELEFRDGTLIAGRLGRDLRVCGGRLVRRKAKKFDLRWTLAPACALAPQDDAGARDLSGRCELALWDSVDTLLRAARQVEHWLLTLRRELAFLLGAVRLRSTMQQRGIPCCFPEPASGGPARSFENLQDLSLALTIPQCVGNTLAGSARLYIVTGANQGGKTTFLRSVGQAQLMMQCGLCVAAERFSGPLCSGIFTHFGREEDEHLRSGKLDEELARLDALIPLLHRDALLLCNESFSSTNEREGSEICRQVTLALLEHGIEQLHVTHLYPFARYFSELHREDVACLRAQWSEDGGRSFRILPGEPSQTAHGADLYRRIWHKEA